MPVFKAIIRVDKKGDDTTNIKIRIFHNKEYDYIKTEYYIKPVLFSNKKGKVKKEHPNCDFLNNKLNQLCLYYEDKALKLDKFTLDNIIVRQLKEYLLEEQSLNVDFFEYCKKRIEEIRNKGTSGCKGTAQSYEDSIERLKEFYDSSVLPFDKITKKFIENFIDSKKTEGKSASSIGIYFRSIKALFNDAKEDLNRVNFEPLIKHNPFRGVELEKAQTKFRNIDIEYLRKIRDIQLTGLEEIARDISMLIFYFIGVNVKDLFYCKGLVNGRFEYTRSKGKKFYSINVEPEAMEIINKYKGEKYLLRFADHTERDLKPHQRILEWYSDHRAFNKMLNQRLKNIAKHKDVEFKEELSTYYFRYAWGNIAREHCGISLDDISMSYGHKKSDLRVTSIYVREKQKMLDVVNRRVLDALK